MIRLTESDSLPRVEDAAERHLRLCAQTKNGDKYSTIIQPYFDDFKEKRLIFGKFEKDVNAAQDTVWLNDSILDDVLRDLHGRTKEFDRNNTASEIINILFPNGNLTPVITTPDKEEPDVAHNIKLKIETLGNNHTLYPFASKIESAVSGCRKALQKQVVAIQAQGAASTALYLSKTALVRKYNANYFLAAGEQGKNYAEKLFPQLRSKKKKVDNESLVNSETM